ncbi:MAG: hypothetical protein ACI8PZ_004703 [Myxococcota bacterium]|jgi:hypothetical protein
MRRWWMVVPVGLALLGCKEQCDEKPGISVGDDNNYAYSATFDVQTIDIAAETDATVCFGEVSTDVRGRPLVSGTIDKVTLSEFTLTTEEVSERVVNNELEQGDTADYFERELSGEFAGLDCVNLSDFEIIGNPLLPEDNLREKDSTRLVTIWRTSAYGREDILMSVVVRPVEGETNTMITMSNTSSVLGFTPDMSSLDTVSVCAEEGKQTFDWEDVTVDTSGAEWSVRKADKLLIGKIDGTVKDAEREFLQLDEMAAELYTMSVYGQTFAKLVEDKSTDQVNQDGEPIWPVDLDGNTFDGFTEDGTWLLGIECSTCTSPAPLFLTVVEVGPPAN